VALAGHIPDHMIHRQGSHIPNTGLALLAAEDGCQIGHAADIGLRDFTCTSYEFALLSSSHSIFFRERWMK